MTLFLIFLTVKLGIFCNFFDPRNLLPSVARYYKFNSENVRRILITPKTKLTSFSR